MQDYFFDSSLGQNIFFLSDKDQLSLKNDFVNSLPWKSFGRKNVGYIYAIFNGAKIIWDFDDDNILKFWLKGATPDVLLEIDDFASNDSESKSKEKSLKI